MKYTIRQAELTLEQMKPLDAQCFIHQEGLAQALDGKLWLAFDEKGNIAAYGCAIMRDGLLDPQQSVDLTRAGVLPEHRGRGLQRRLIRARLTWGKKNGAKQAWTYTDGENEFSMKSLVKTGFFPFRIDGRFLEFQRSL